MSDGGVVGVLDDRPTTRQDGGPLATDPPDSEPDTPTVVAEWATGAGFQASIVDWQDDWPAVLWWHRDRPFADRTTFAAYSDRIAAHLEEGHRILLTGRAAAASVALGIDDVEPDVVGREATHEPTGILRKSIFADHALFDGLEGLRVHTAPGEAGVPFARYEHAVPRNGEVLASSLTGHDDHPHQAAIVAWQTDPGSVLSIGTGVSFTGYGHENAARDTLLRNALRLLVTDTDLPTRPRSATELTDLRRETDADRHRPRYHITPPANWLNDPNGVCQWNGRYHVFYQYNPAGPYHNCIHWGHVVSDDIVHWHDEPVALTPDPDGPDADGCWSGCLVDDDGTPTILYTGGRGRDQLPCHATSTDPDLRTWEKHPENPIIEDAPTDVDVLETEHWRAEFRDHCVWRDGDTWYQLIGSGITDVGGAVFLYASDDLEDWTYRGPFLAGDWEGSGHMWECPELLDLGDRHLLHVSNYDGVPYYLGTVEDERFVRDPTSDGLLDHGDFYAPQSMRTDDGRVVTFGWLWEARTEAAQWDAGWSGAMSLPRELSLDDDGDLRQRPARELTALRGHETRRQDVRVGDTGVPLEPAGRHLEVELTARLGDADAFELAVLEAANGHERTPITWTRDGEIVVDRGPSSDDPSVDDAVQSMPAPVDADGTLSLRVFVDGSVVEVFAADREVLTSRVYPTRTDANGIRLRGIGGEAVVEAVAVWPLEGAWPALE